nr:hypothetical protein [Acidimicrobiales bacterium]
MGKASSAKKVARAARAGGGPSRDKPKLGFPAAIVGIFVVGLLLVVFSYGQRNNRAEAEAPSAVNSDHWHTAYGVYVCDTFQEPIPDQGTDPVGIHTHGDGVIHIHPFSEASSGDNAQLYHFTDL